MQLDVTFRNLKAREEVRQRAKALFERNLGRFLDPASEASLIVSVQRGVKNLELRVTSRGNTHVASVDDAELRTALDKVFHTMENTLRRAKERRTDRRHEPNDEFGGAPPEPEVDADPDEVA